MGALSDSNQLFARVMCNAVAQDRLEILLGGEVDEGGHGGENKLSRNKLGFTLENSLDQLTQVTIVIGRT